MSVTVTQDIESRYVPGKEAEFHYTIRAAANEAAARDALTAAVPAAYEGLIRQRREINAQYVDSTRPASNIWKATVFYGLVTSDDFTTSFDTTGGSQHITQSPLTVGRYPAGAPNTQGAIGYDGQRVNGVDIVVPTYAFSETHIKTQAQVSNSYRHLLALMTGGVNHAPFRGFADGEVQFRGVSGQLVTLEGQQKWQLTFQFAASPNRIDIPVGGITVPLKYGWDYLWVMYGDSINEGRLIQQPVAAYLERLYPFVNFADLAIGTS
ncbi:MAG: hypothetical protein GXY41_03840 [Phycisphaerae bacterium]|nr:hypothetical protein [Phycisphaerae bacterium]